MQHVTELWQSSYDFLSTTKLKMTAQHQAPQSSLAARKYYTFMKLDEDVISKELLLSILKSNKMRLASGNFFI